MSQSKKSRKFTSAEEVLGSGKKQSDTEISGNLTEPTSEEFNEVFTPDLSADTFIIADKTFRIKISNIKTQKIMAKSLTAIDDLLGKIDVVKIVKKLQQLIVSKEDNNEELVGMASFVKEIINQTGMSKIAIAIMDLYTNVVFAICHSQDSEITIDWIEENINFVFAQNIFARQMIKDQIQGKVIDFLSILTRLLIGNGSDIQTI